MRPLLRKLRGALGTALTWAVAWTVGGFALITFVYVVGPGLDGMPFWDIAPSLALRVGMSGFIGGGIFSAVLGVIHRRRELGDLNPARMGLWGFLAGFLIPSGILVLAVRGIPLSVEAIGSALFIFGGLGVATSVATVKLAQLGTGEIESADPTQLSSPPE